MIQNYINAEQRIAETNHLDHISKKLRCRAGQSFQVLLYYSTIPEPSLNVMGWMVHFSWHSSDILMHFTVIVHVLLILRPITSFHCHSFHDALYSWARMYVVSGLSIFTTFVTCLSYCLICGGSKGPMMVTSNLREQSLTTSKEQLYR